MLSFTMRTAPLVARTVFSRIGPSCLHGPHHGAQKSTTTGASKDPSTTSAMKFAVVTSFTGAAPVPPIKGSLGIAFLFGLWKTTWLLDEGKTSTASVRFRSGQGGIIPCHETIRPAR